MENTLTWLLVADASKARIFSMHKAKLFQNEHHSNLLKLIDELTHHESRMKSTDLVSDRLGGFNKNSYGIEQPKTHEAEVFAHRLLEQLDLARKDRHFHDLILIAPPTFMGMLHKFMPHEMQKLICKTIEKDYTQETLHGLTEKLIAHL